MNMSGRDPWTAGASDKRSQTGVALWSLLWVAAFLVADLAMDRGWIEGDTTVIAVTAGVAILAIGWVVAYLRLLRNADELMRRIQLEAMALALASGFVGGFALLLLGSGDVAQPDLATLLVLMAVVYVIALLLGRRRFGADSG